ncbi:MAG TPA: RdgB/HAM1 family non-canonical purine NTP pyrophosphatase [Fimbriimonadaceae bacterium]|nr:RdgB/HAM1 family non-canonical purine NTP pyrophosphatase [Fimbriimonadaceae bacterium]HRJ33219.1 RdgB/HAM1 family non-canonical purine NTP pyrophosphatase [Fimbriimonadaceae bacterium]
MKLVLATHNAKKGAEMLQILGEKLPNLEIRTLADYPGAPEPDETGTTYEANACIKAESALDWTQEWCVADDAGLEIDALGGEPGLYSKRFAGEETPFPEKMARILELLAGVPEEKRTARFRCWVALARPGAPTETFEGICEGRITLQPSGQGGFGYDPIFGLPALGCTMADLTAEQKHAISHRGRVLAQLGARLRELQSTPVTPAS